MASETLPVRMCGKTSNHGPHDYRTSTFRKYHCPGLNRRSPNWRRNESERNQ